MALATTLSVFKSHGLGNDYLVYESGPTLTPHLCRRICDRNRGIGADGILEPQPTVHADYGVRIWNPDGSTSEKSGNGLRIFAHWLTLEKTNAKSFHIDTGAAIVSAVVSGDHVEIEMGQATFEPKEIPINSTHSLIESPIDVNGEMLCVTAVGMGNPHCVVFVEDTLDSTPWNEWGEALETNSIFPNRTNVQIARVLTENSVEARIFERGAGPTLASGSSACAVVAAGIKTRRLNTGLTQVMMPGGSLHVTIDKEFNVKQRGPVAPVGRFVFHKNWE